MPERPVVKLVYRNGVPAPDQPCGCWYSGDGYPQALCAEHAFSLSWSGPDEEDLEPDSDRLLRPVPGHRWPYGPPYCHEESCRLHTGGGPREGLEHRRLTKRAPHIAVTPLHLDLALVSQGAKYGYDLSLGGVGLR